LIVFTPLIGALLAAGAAFITNWLALIPWRRVKGAHWTEQARLLYPARAAARSNLVGIPAIAALGVLLVWPDRSFWWLPTGVVSLVAVCLANFPLDREIFPRISVADLLYQAMVGLVLRLLIWFVFLGAAVMMPDEFNASCLAMGAVVLWSWTLWARDGFIWAGRKLGLLLAAPERLQTIATETSTRMNIPFREVLLIRVPIAQAYALQGRRKLMFTNRLLEILSDEEIAAICAHELAHLTESKGARFSRSIRILTFYPWVFFRPLSHALGPPALFILCGITLLVPGIYRSFSRKQESRADRMAKANEAEAGVYARALARLYEDNLVPAVAAKRRSTHPDLYDRLLAAGIQPDFPRPLPAKTMGWNGFLFAMLAGWLFAVFAMRLMGTFNGTFGGN
jgi:Zn-dependent protease with chaperone function